VVDCKGAHGEQDLSLTGVRWFVAYPVRYRPLEARLQARGVSGEQAPIKRGGLPYSPPLDAACHRRKRPVWGSWRLDATSLRLRGHWRDRSRAVAKTGQTLDFLRPEQRGERAALRFLTQATHRHHVPETITSDGREAHAAAIRRDNPEHGTAIISRRVQ
jgi:transposase-like protein